MAIWIPFPFHTHYVLFIRWLFLTLFSCFQKFGYDVPMYGFLRSYFLSRVLFEFENWGILSVFRPIISSTIFCTFFIWYHSKFIRYIMIVVSLFDYDSWPLAQFFFLVFVCFFICVVATNLPWFSFTVSAAVRTMVKVCCLILSSPNHQLGFLLFI